jgi:TetR/AcrR family transcriptional repressor of nem operon
MRYTADHKKETRERIVKAASRQIRGQGGEGPAIADLMRDLDLTHGGFYKHFRSKEQLMIEAIVKGFDETEAWFAEAVGRAEPGDELKVIIERYLSLQHCANPAGGCPVAALASEIARYPRAMRLEVDREIRKRINRMAGFLPGATSEERERNCLVLFSGMAGALSLARATPDLESRKKILEVARDFYTKTFCH